MDPLYSIPLSILGFLCIYMTVSYLIYRKIFLRKHYQSKVFVDHEDPFFQPSWDWFHRSPKEIVKLKAYDGTILSATFLPSYDEKSNQTAIVLHGYQSQSTDMIVVAKMYNDLGFKVLLVDQRGHGLSQGTFTSFGHYEKQDLRKWVLYALRTHGATDKILIDGVSMGAATAMLAAALPLPENVKLIVADCGFSSLTKLFIKNSKAKMAILFLPGIDLITLYFHRYFLSQVNPKKAVAKSKIPIFFIHGKLDEEVPYSMALDLYQTSKAPFKELYTVENAKHAQSYVVDKAGLEKRLIEIICRFFDIKKSILKQKK